MTAAAAAAPYWARREALPLGAFSAAALSGDYDAAATTRNVATEAALASTIVGRALQQPARSTARCCRISFP